MTEQNKFIVAIDGHSSCGKSTIAKQLAEHFKFLYIDTGAMYRCITLLLLDHNIAFTDADAIEKLLHDTKIYFKKLEDGQHTYINGRDVSTEIRSPRVSNQVSEVATISMVRQKLVEQQRWYALENDLVMDGRDIGTVVYPNANLKIFLTATKAVRAQRRFDELKEKNIEITHEAVMANNTKRDHIDSTRADSPLKKAEDAIVVDNSDLTKDEQFQLLKGLIEKAMAK